MSGYKNKEKLEKRDEILDRENCAKYQLEKKMNNYSVQNRLCQKHSELCSFEISGFIGYLEIQFLLLLG